MLRGWNRGALIGAWVIVGALGCDDGPDTVEPVDMDVVDAEVDPQVDAMTEVDMMLLEGRVAIASPAAGAVIDGAADLDGDLDNGIQLEVRIEAEGTDDRLVRISTSAGADPREEVLVDGVAVTTITLPAVEEGTFRVRAAIFSNGEPLIDEIELNVAVGTCALTLEPLPSGARCDAGAADDLDPERPGVQVDLAVESDCDTVIVSVGGVPQTIEIVDGAATVRITLADGQSVVSATAEGAGRRPVEVGPLTYQARTTAPQLELDLFDEIANVLGLGQAVVEGDRAIWRIEGTGRGLDPGAEVSVVFLPALDGAPETLAVDEAGRFSIPVTLPLEQSWAGTLTVSAVDACGTPAESATVAVQLDTVTPRVRIVSPADGVRLTALDDIDPDRPDIQIPVTVEVDDPREGADYRISVLCGPPGSDVRDQRARAPEDAITRGEDRPIIATFRVEERGELVCVAFAESFPNPAAADETLYRLFFEQPTFTVEAPTRDAGCFTGETIEVRGQGALLDGNAPALLVVPQPEGGPALAPIPLAALGEQTYAATLGRDRLPDGRFTLRVDGTVFGRVPVSVVPAEIPIEVDRTAPTVEILSPVEPFLADDDPGTAGFQYTPQVEVCGAAGRTLTVDVDPPLDGGPLTAEVPAGACATIELPPQTAPLGPIRLTARVDDACGNTAEARRSTRIEPARVAARIISPTDGDGVAADLDDDPLAAGCQVELEGLLSGLGPDADVAVCTSVAQGGADPLCDGGSDARIGECEVMAIADSGTTLRCPVSLADGTHTLTLVGETNARVSSAPIQVRVDCSPPAVQTLAVEQDADADGCINRQERLNAAEGGDNARVTVRFATEGIDDGDSVRVRTLGGADLGGATVQGGVGQTTVSLLPGVYRVYLRGQDRAGNLLPGPGDDGLVLLPVEVDTRPPTPAVVGFEPDVCLAASDDAALGVPGLQYDLRVDSGRAADEEVDVAFGVDGEAVAVESGALDGAEARLDLADGQRAITATVTDACGNVGSVAGFVRVGGLPDWSRPLPLTVQVDTQPPALTLEGVADGAVIDGADDADGDPGNGLQQDLTVVVNPPAGLEAGQAVTITSDGNPVLTTPAPLIVPAPFAGRLPARLTLTGGPQMLAAQATDACGNTGSSAPIDIDVDVAGCTSRVVGFEANPAVLGAEDGVVGPSGLGLTIAGQVDLLDLDCVGAPVQLIIDDSRVGQAVVPADGAVEFPGVELDRGAHTIALRVGPVRDVTLNSPAQQLIVDLDGPTVTIDRPDGETPLVTDDRGDLAGQQVAVVASVTEARVDSARTATLSIDGAPVAGPAPVPGGGVATVTFRDVTVPAGPSTVEVCVTDAVGNTDCATVDIDADAAPPGALAPVEVQIVDPRSTEVTLSFTAPGDDGLGGAPVTAYAVRRSDQAIADEADWAAAAASEVRLPAIAAPGDGETLTLQGPGPALADGLALEVLHQVALRAIDDAGREGPLVSVTVDLRLAVATGTIVPRAGAWENGDAINTTSPIVGVGDLDGDGFDDAVLSVTQGGGATQGALLFGAANPAQAVTRSLALAPGMTDLFFGVVAAAGGDLNGDGAPDVAVQGYLDGFAGVAVALYFGCPDPANCDRAELAQPDALITSAGGRFTNMLAGVGEAWAPQGGGFDDLVVSGSLGADTDAFLVAGRADWPALPGAVTIGPGAGPDVASLVLPLGPPGVYAGGLGDQDGDGFAEIGLSAGGDINDTYIFAGGFDGDALSFGDPGTAQLADPCPAENPSFGSFFVGGVDLDGDMARRPDFVVGNRGNKRLVVFDADRASLDCFGRSPGLYGRVFDLAGDVDGNGAVDLVVTHGDPGVSPADIFLNDGQGRFGVGDVVTPRGADVRLDRAGQRKLGVAGVGDFNGDGRDDIGGIFLDGDGEMTWIVYY